jgi:hypothetical protein
VRERPVHLFEQKVATIWENRSRGGQRGHFWFGGENPRTFQSAGTLPRVRHQNYAVIPYWIGGTGQGDATLEIRSGEGARVHRTTVPGNPGIGRYEWDYRFDGGEEAGPGTYHLTLSRGASTSTTTLVVREDPILREGAADR